LKRGGEDDAEEERGREEEEEKREEKKPSWALSLMTVFRADAFTGRCGDGQLVPVDGSRRLC
jgi:hypothetical protein